MAEPTVFEIPAEVVLRLRDLSASQDIALSTALATATAALLHRYSCEGTLAIRTTNPARSEAWVGLLPVTTLIPDDPSFEQLLARARQTLSNRPEGPEIEILMPPGLRNESQPLKLGFREESGRLIGTLDASLMSMAQHLQMLLRGVIGAPTAPLSTIDILGAQETRQILIDWNQTDCGYPQACLPELFERQAQRTPNAVALIQGIEKLTYIQLDQKANRLANYLRKRGVGLGMGPEVLVGFCMQQSLDAVVAVLGILKAGGAYVPLDPSYPEHRLQEIASDAKLAIAVTSAKFRDRVPPGIETICVDRDNVLIAAESVSAPAADITPETAAYVLYTSASTGKPKGVVGIHRSITNGLKSMNYAPGEVCCLNAFLSYAFSIASLFLPLMSGVPVVILSDEQIRDANQMMTVLEKEGVTRLILVPDVLQQILDPDFGAASRLKKVTTIAVAGSRLTPSHFQRLHEAMPQAKLQNRYASTEIGTVAAVWDVPAESLAGGGDIPIGRPAANTRIYILDRYRKPVPVGVAGEICVSAAHLARGYLNRPELTQERFLPDPFERVGAEPRRRLYRTGDLGRFRADGVIEFVGRTDHQVKINGFRIDLPEVERVLASHIGVSDAVTAVCEIGHSQRLVAYVVAKPIGTPSAGQLRKYLQDRLPEYMVPSRFVFLDKIDRNALPAPKPVRPNLETSYQPPGNPMEAAIAQVWSELLGLEPIGIHDHFRDLGGDSIMAAHVALRLSERFGLDITPEALLERPTVAELARYLAGPRAASHGAQFGCY